MSQIKTIFGCKPHLNGLRINENVCSKGKTLLAAYKKYNFAKVRETIVTDRRPTIYDVVAIEGMLNRYLERTLSNNLCMRGIAGKFVQKLLSSDWPYVTSRSCLH